MPPFMGPPSSAELRAVAACAVKPQGPLIGRHEPRLWTPPLRELTPDTSLGFDAIRFAERVCRIPLLPWQKWWLIHALETKPDGSFRFRIILTLIARQNGKTFLLKILALYFLYVLRVPLVVGAAQKLDVAAESWDATYRIAAAVSALRRELRPPARRGLMAGRSDANGKEEIELYGGPDCGDCADPAVTCGEPGHWRRYKVTAMTEGSARGLTVNLLIPDEIRQQRDQKAWAAISKTTLAVRNSLIVPISNAGDDESVVLNMLRAAALVDDADEGLGLMEWSAPDGCDLMDVQAWAQANPSLGYTLTAEALRLAARTDTPEVYRTECLCQHVRALDVLVNPDAWRNCNDPQLTLNSVRDRVVTCLEVAPDGAHATLVAAAKFDDGKVGLDVVAAWTDLRAAERELPGLLERVKPVAFGWFPAGPAAELAHICRRQRNAEEITGAAVTEACQGYVGAIHRGGVRHRDDPLLSSHTIAARRVAVSDGYRFTRKGGHVDAAYAAAGALKLAQSMQARSGSGVWVV